MIKMPFSSITEAVLLVALGLGYIVLYLANREEKTLKTTGYFIGVFIVVLSSLLILTNLILSARICSRVGGIMPQRLMKWQVPPVTPPPQK